MKMEDFFFVCKSTKQTDTLAAEDVIASCCECEWARRVKHADYMYIFFSKDFIDGNFFSYLCTTVPWEIMMLNARNCFFSCLLVKWIKMLEYFRLLNKYVQYM